MPSSGCCGNWLSSACVSSAKTGYRSRIDRLHERMIDVNLGAGRIENVNLAALAKSYHADRLCQMAIALPPHKTPSQAPSYLRQGHLQGARPRRTHLQPARFGKHLCAFAPCDPATSGPFTPLLQSRRRNLSAESCGGRRGLPFPPSKQKKTAAPEDGGYFIRYVGT
jgi:hypothetical protein